MGEKANNMTKRLSDTELGVLELNIRNGREVPSWLALRLIEEIRTYGRADVKTLDNVTTLSKQQNLNGLVPHKGGW